MKENIVYNKLQPHARRENTASVLAATLERWQMCLVTLSPCVVLDFIREKDGNAPLELVSMPYKKYGTEQKSPIRRLKFARTGCQSVLRVRFQLFIFLLSRTTVLFHFFSSLFFFSFSRFCHERDVICGRRMTHFERLTALWNYFTASFNSRFSPLPN